MKIPYLAACLSAVISLGPALAQEAPAQEVLAQSENPGSTAAAQPAAEEWQAFSQNDRTIYLVRLSPTPTVDGITQVHIARLPPQRPSSDLSYKLDEYELRCQGEQIRLIAESEYDEGGTLIERYPDASAEFEKIRSTSLGAYFKPLVCDGARVRGESAPSVRAFIERGRK